MTNVNSINRRRRRKGNKVSLALTIMFIITFIFLLMSLGNMDSYGDGEVEYIKVTVEAGESLWSIAEKFTPGHRDLRETMYDIIDHNELVSQTIHPGQVIEVPRVY